MDQFLSNNDIVNIQRTSSNNLFATLNTVSKTNHAEHFMDTTDNGQSSVLDNYSTPLEVNGDVSEDSSHDSDHGSDNQPVVMLVEEDISDTEAGVSGKLSGGLVDVVGNGNESAANTQVCCACS